MKRIFTLALLATLAQGCTTVHLRAQGPSLMSSQIATYRLSAINNMSKQDLGSVISNDCINDQPDNRPYLVHSASGAIEKLKVQAYRKGANVITPPSCQSRFHTASCQQEVNCTAQAWHVDQIDGPHPVKDAPNIVDAFITQPVAKRFHLPQSAFGKQQ